MVKTTYPAHVAAEILAIRPDLQTTDGIDAIRTILTCTPTLTAQDAIDIIDEATADAESEQYADRYVAEEEASRLADAEESPESTDVRCECGRVTGVRCEWSGPVDETVVVEWMPEALRASHEAAGNSGSYPHNGAQRITMERSCAEHLADDWTIIRG